MAFNETLEMKTSRELKGMFGKESELLVSELSDFWNNCNAEENK
jgi:hypothetical protein